MTHMCVEDFEGLVRTLTVIRVRFLRFITEVQRKQRKNQF
jgi:hypothetical protein